MIVFVKKMFSGTKFSQLMSCFWKLYYSAHMILRDLKYTQSIVMTFLPKVLEFVISIFKSFADMNAYMK